MKQGFIIPVAVMLENYFKENSFQWYNFHDCWLKEA